jgi:hypothetical protein
MDADLHDPADARLRAARPPAADVDPDAFDPALLARVTAHGRSRAVRGRLAMPMAFVAAVAVASVVALAGRPALTHAPRPTSAAAAAIGRASGWFELPAGKILHYRTVTTDLPPTGRRSTVTQEFWQSTDDPSATRRSERFDGVAVEVSNGSLYDPARDTIYAYVAPSTRELIANIRADVGRKVEAARRAGDAKAARDIATVRDQLIADARAGRLDDAGPVSRQAGDDLVERLHGALDAGEAKAGEAQLRNGLASLPITLDAGGHVRWTLWIAADDSRPLELVVDHGDGTRVVHTVDFTVYQLLPAGEAEQLLTLEGAHPDARVVESRSAYRAAEARLFPNG